MSFESYLNGLKKNRIILEDDFFIAIIEEKPLVNGHCVVFPKQVVDSFLDLTDEQISKIMIFSKRVGHAIEQVVSCKKIGMAVIGLQVRHAHLHLVPIKSADDLNFTRAKLEVSEGGLMEMASLIRENI